MKFVLCNLFFFSLFFRGVLPTKTFEIMLVFIFVLSVVSSLTKTRAKVDIQTFGLILFIIISALFQVYFTQHLSFLANHVVYLCQGVLVFYSVRYICSLTGTNYALNSLIFWAMIVSFISVAFYILNIYNSSPIFDLVIYQKTGMARLTGFQTNPNYFALTICVIPLLCLTLPKVRYKKRCVFIVLIAILFSGSRGGILAALVPLILYLYMNSKHKIFYGAILIIILFSVVSLINTDLVPMLSRFDASNSNFSSGRTEHWIKAIDLFGENYFYGVGNNSFSLYETENGNPIQVHNNYLRLLAEGGLIYFLSWVVFILFLGLRNKFKREYYFIILPLLVFSLVNDPYISKEFWLYLSIAILVSEYSNDLYA